MVHGINESCASPYNKKCINIANPTERMIGNKVKDVCNNYLCVQDVIWGLLHATATLLETNLHMAEATAVQEEANHQFREAP